MTEGRTPDPAEQETERSFGPPSDETDRDALIAHVQDQAHRNLTSVTVDEDEDGYTVTHHSLSAKDAARLIRAHGKPLSRAAKRALYWLGELRARRGGRNPKYSPEAVARYTKKALDYRARGYGLRAIERALGPSRTQLSRWLRQAQKAGELRDHVGRTDPDNIVRPG